MDIPGGSQSGLLGHTAPGPAPAASGNMAATLAVSRAVEQTCGLTPSIKWPNDVRLGGRKVAGILVESVVRAAMRRSQWRASASTSISTHHPRRRSRPQPPASWSRADAGLTGGRCSSLPLEGFDDLYRTVSNGGSLTQDWAAGLETLGRHVRVEWKELVVEGRAESVDEHGNLLLRTADGSAFTASAGEVTLQARNGHGIEERNA